jgi:hypothetical protein
MFRVADEQTAERDSLVASGLSRREARARVLQKGRDALPDEADVVDLAALWSTVVYITGQGPTDTKYVNPADDPAHH